MAQVLGLQQRTVFLIARLQQHRLAVQQASDLSVFVECLLHLLLQLGIVLSKSGDVLGEILIDLLQFMVLLLKALLLLARKLTAPFKFLQLSLFLS